MVSVVLNGIYKPGEALSLPVEWGTKERRRTKECSLLFILYGAYIKITL